MTTHDEHGEVTEEFRLAEQRDDQEVHGVQPPVDPGAGDDLDDQLVDDEVRAHYQEMTSLGANDQGEGKIP